MAKQNLHYPDKLTKYIKVEHKIWIRCQNIRKKNVISTYTFHQVSKKKKREKLLVNNFQRWGENGFFRIIRGTNAAGIERGSIDYLIIEAEDV